MEQPESRALGKPKETVETKQASEAEQWMEGLTVDELKAFWRGLPAREGDADHEPAAAAGP
jgi:hypothetical protein